LLVKSLVSAALRPMPAPTISAVLYTMVCIENFLW
jgi:hypothetical protein